MNAALHRGAELVHAVPGGDEVRRARSARSRGPSYEAKGLYRPEADCIMFTRDEVGFCRVCQRAISRIIDMYAR